MENILTATADTDTRQTVRNGKRVIGFLINVQVAALPKGWRFLPNRKDVAAVYPAPSPTFPTAEQALTDVQQRLAC